MIRKTNERGINLSGFLEVKLIDYLLDYDNFADSVGPLRTTLTHIL